MIDKSTISDLVKLEGLPDNIAISTITITFSLNNTMNSQNIARYCDITEKSFNKIFFGVLPDDLSKITENDKCVVRSYHPILKKRKRMSNKRNNNTNSEINELNNYIEQQAMKSGGKRKNSENNQCRVKIWSDITQDCVSASIFNNGSVHVTGIKSHQMFEEIYEKLFSEITKQKYVLNSETGAMVYKPFAEEPIPDTMRTKVENFQICMINCTLDVYFNIKLIELHSIMKAMGAPSKLDVSKHACVNTKFNYKDFHEVSIFIFESGKINITGSRSYEEIMSAYEYIVCILYENFKKIMLISVDSLDPQVLNKYILK
jgi:TATA-box binding protein (TBP) (component of TFIID and TFIIIB)